MDNNIKNKVQEYTKELQRSFGNFALTNNILYGIKDSISELLRYYKKCREISDFKVGKIFDEEILSEKIFFIPIEIYHFDKSMENFYIEIK